MSYQSSEQAIAGEAAAAAAKQKDRMLDEEGFRVIKSQNGGSRQWQLPTYTRGIADGTACYIPVSTRKSENEYERVYEHIDDTNEPPVPLV